MLARMTPSAIVVFMAMYVKITFPDGPMVHVKTRNAKSPHVYKISIYQTMYVKKTRMIVAVSYAPHAKLMNSVPTVHAQMPAILHAKPVKFISMDYVQNPAEH